MYNLIRLQTSLALFMIIEIVLFGLIAEFNLNYDYYILYTILNIVFISNVYIAKIYQNVFHFILHVNFTIFYLLPSFISIFIPDISQFPTSTGVTPDAFYYFEAYIYGTVVYALTFVILFFIPKFKINPISYRSTKLLMIVHYLIVTVSYLLLYLSDGWGKNEFSIMASYITRFFPESTLYMLLIMAFVQKQKKVAIYAFAPTIPSMLFSKSAIFGLLMIFLVLLLMYDKSVIKSASKNTKNTLVIILLLVSGFYFGLSGRKYFQSGVISFVDSVSYAKSVLYRTSIPDTISLIKYSVDGNNKIYKQKMKNEMYSTEFQLKNIANAYVIGEVFDFSQPLFNTFPMIYLGYSFERIHNWYQSWHQSLEGYLLAKYESYVIGIILAPLYIFSFALFVIYISYIFKNYQLYALVFLIYYSFRGYVNFFSIEMTVASVISQIYNMFILIIILELTHLGKYLPRINSSLIKMYKIFLNFKLNNII